MNWKKVVKKENLRWYCFFSAVLSLTMASIYSFNYMDVTQEGPLWEVPAGAAQEAYESMRIVIVFSSAAFIFAAISIKRLFKLKYFSFLLIFIWLAFLGLVIYIGDDFMQYKITHRKLSDILNGSFLAGAGISLLFGAALLFLGIRQMLRERQTNN